MRALKLLMLGVLVSGAAFAQGSDVEKATLHYDLAQLTAPAAIATTPASSAEVGKEKAPAGDVIDLLLSKAGKKEKKILTKILKAGEDSGVLTRERIAQHLGKINVSAIMGLYENVRSLKVSGFDLKKLEQVKETLLQIDGQLKEAGVKPVEFGKLSFFAGMARDQLANMAPEPAQKQSLKMAAVQNYQDTINNLAAEKDPASLEKVMDATERQVTLQHDFGKTVPVAPVKGLSKAVITSDYGMRVHPVKKVKRFHSGVDLAGWKCKGWKVKAIGPGRVVKSGWETGYGYAVVISHEIDGRALFTRYAHLKKASRLASGKVVKTGDLVGYCNNSGISTGSHLHFEVRENSASGATLDPKEYLPVVEVMK